MIAASHSAGPRCTPTVEALFSWSGGVDWSIVSLNAGDVIASRSLTLRTFPFRHRLDVQWREQLYYDERAAAGSLRLSSDPLPFDDVPAIRPSPAAALLIRLFLSTHESSRLRLRMGDAIKRLFHRRNWSTDKDFKPSHLQSFSYRDATPGTPPRRGSLPLRGDVVLTANRPHNTPVYSASPTRIRRPASVGSSHRSRVHRNRLRRVVSDASRRGRAENLWKTEHGDVRNSEEMSPPPLPGTAVSSDHARYGNGNARLTARQSSAGSESYYEEDVADRVLAESFPNPPAANRSSYPAPLSVPSKGLNPRDTASYSLDEEASPLSDQWRVNNTQSRLFLDNSSDEESLRESSRERPKRDSRGSLRRKRAYSSGLRDFTDPTNRLSVQEPAEGYHTDGYPEQSAHQSYLIDSTPSLEGIVDLGNTEDIAYHTRYAPAVTHETVFPEVHEIREEQVFREIHTHDVFHRILPVVDVEVLPTRHFIRTEDGGLREIPEEQIPGRSTDNQAWLIASRRTRDETTATEPRQFTAREFPGTEGDEVRYTTKEGFERTEMTWVHPPTIETEALYMPSPNADEHRGADSETKVEKDLAGGIRDAPFDECAEYEVASERMKSLHIKSDSGVGRM